MASIQEHRPVADQIRSSARRHSVKIAETSRRVIDTDYVPD